VEANLTEIDTLSATAHGRVEQHTDHGGRRGLFAAERLAAGTILAWVRGTPRRTPGRFTLQLGKELHVDDLGAVESTNHACEPSAWVDFEGTEVCLRALRDLEAGDEVTIDYCATEDRMSTPFACHCGAAGCYGWVAGYSVLETERRVALAGRLAPHLVEKYGRPGT